MRPKIDHALHAREEIDGWIAMAQCYSTLRAIGWLFSYKRRFKDQKFILIKTRKYLGSWYILRKPKDEKSVCDYCGKAVRDYYVINKSSTACCKCRKKLKKSGQI